MCGEKLGINFQWQSKLFLVVIFNFLLVKTAVNAPRLCKLLKDCPTGIGICNKTPPFLHCQLSKVEQEPLRTYQLVP
jgi:hypothetical protein